MDNVKTAYMDIVHGGMHKYYHVEMWAGAGRFQVVAVWGYIQDQRGGRLSEVGTAVQYDGDSEPDAQAAFTRCVGKRTGMGFTDYQPK
jgi:hypothetical protein